MSKIAPDGIPDTYIYDLESVVFASLGGEVTPSLSEREYDGYRYILGWNASKQRAAYPALLSLVGCLDAPLGDDA